MPEFFRWMAENNYRYAVLRSFLGLEAGYPPPGSKQDIDMLVDDIAIGPIREKYGGTGKRRGIKCDFYHVRSAHDGAYLGEADYPRLMAESILKNRRLWHGLFYVPAADDHYLSLLYTIAYHKAESSGIDTDDPAKSQNSKYAAELDMLEAERGSKLPRCLSAFDDFLRQEGYAPGYSRLARNIQNKKTSSPFLARLCALLPGHFGLFMAGKDFITRGKLDFLLKDLRRDFHLIEVKPLSLPERLRLIATPWRHTRIVIAAVTQSGAETHASYRQEITSYLKWSVARSPRRWPLSCTQSEEEALRILPRFFNPQECAAIYAKRPECLKE